MSQIVCAAWYNRETIANPIYIVENRLLAIVGFWNKNRKQF